jgi:hypothetical protein
LPGWGAISISSSPSTMPPRRSLDHLVSGGQQRFGVKQSAVRVDKIEAKIASNKHVPAALAGRQFLRAPRTRQRNRLAEQRGADLIDDSGQHGLLAPSRSAAGEHPGRAGATAVACATDKQVLPSPDNATEIPCSASAAPPAPRTAAVFRFRPAKLHAYALGARPTPRAKAAYRASGQAADERNRRLFGLSDRGRLAPRLRAEVNLIDFDRLRLHKPELVHDMPASGKRFVPMPGRLVRAGQNGRG